LRLRTALARLPGVRRIGPAIVVLLAMLVPAPAAWAGLPTAGIYLVWGSDSLATQPYVRGGQISLEWSQVEPSRGKFDWSSLDSELGYYHGIGKQATIQVNSTSAKPTWLWNVVANCGKVQNQPAPQYWDPVYMNVQTELVSALAAHLKASPYLTNVALVRAAPNAIGTELTTMPSTYTCKATPSGHKVSTAWSTTIANQYYYDVMNLYRLQMLPQVQVALRAQLWTQWPQNSPTSWLESGGAMIMGTASDVDPNPVRDAFDQYAYQEVRCGTGNAYWEPISYGGKKNLVSWNWWRILLELDKGVRSIAVYGDLLSKGATDPEYRAAFDFANRYAGHQWDAAHSPGAWVALRQGSGRMAGDFTWFMTQLNPDTTSTAVDSNAGGSMIGPATQRFGRYARRIAGGTSKSTMSFVLAPAFRTGLGSVSTSLRVTYLDTGTGRFQVRWGTGATQVATVAKSASGIWKTATLTVPGSSYSAALPGGADVAVSETGSDATDFAMVEVSVPTR
jgi:Beta-galactosidase